MDAETGAPGEFDTFENAMAGDRPSTLGVGFAGAHSYGRGTSLPMEAQVYAIVSRLACQNPRFRGDMLLDGFRRFLVCPRDRPCPVSVLASTRVLVWPIRAAQTPSLASAHKR